MEKELDRDLPLKKEIAENIQKLMDGWGWKQKDLVERSGIKRSTLSDYMNCKTLINPGNVEKLSEVFNVAKYEIDPSFRTQLHLNETPSVYKVINKCTDDYYYFPIAVSAGLPTNIDGIVDGETITIPDELLGKYAGRKDIYFIRVNGESMNKIIPHESLIAVKQTTADELKDGDIIVYSNSYDYSIKRFYQDGDKLIFKPESTDPKFTDYIIEKTSEDLRLHGKVITYIVNLN